MGSLARFPMHGKSTSEAAEALQGYAAAVCSERDVEDRRQCVAIELVVMTTAAVFSADALGLMPQWLCLATANAIIPKIGRRWNF